MEKGEIYQINILELHDDIGYWLLRADGGKYYDDFFLNNFVAISDNEITLEMISELEKNSIAGITIDHYKNLYREKYPKWKNQQIAHAASRTEKFINQIKIGDIVLVPSKKSVNFLLGVVDSEVYEITEEEVNSGERVNYIITPFLKRRKVRWLKEIPRGEISEKLHWVLSAHQTIFDLHKYKDYINQLLSPIYIQNGTCHGTIKINKKEGLNSDEWYKLYSIIKEYSDTSEEEVIVKTDVQSPGSIEFTVNDIITTVTIVIALSAPIIGDINLKCVKIKGIIPFFISYKEEKLKREKMEKEIEILEEEKRTIQIENDRAEFELEKEKEIWKIKKETEVEQLRQQLQISSFDAGRTVVNQKQTDNSENLSADEF